MKCQVLQPFRLKTKQREQELQPGQVINLADDKALILIQQGKISLADPELQDTYQERSAIMEHDGGLDREEAERQAWCRSACMLSFPTQWDTCTRFKPKPCLRLTHSKS